MVTWVFSHCGIVRWILGGLYRTVLSGFYFAVLRGKLTGLAGGGFRGEEGLRPFPVRWKVECLTTIRCVV